MDNIYKNLIKNISKNKVINSNINDSNFIMLKNKTIDKCPYCKNKEFIKYGNYNKAQRYKCKNINCGKTFTSETYNVFRYSKKFKQKFQEYFSLLNEGLTIRQCAEKLNITIVTSFFWRHRCLFYLKRKYYIEKINNHVELSKMIITENFKGSREIENKRRDKIVVVNAINNISDSIPIFAARNIFGIYEVRDNILPRLEKGAYVVGHFDGKLKAFSEAFNEIYKTKLKPQCNTIIDKCYSNNTKRWLVKFRGVATKYLDHYLYFRLFIYKNNRALIEENDVDYKSIYEVNSYIAWKNIKLKKLNI